MVRDLIDGGIVWIDRAIHDKLLELDKGLVKSIALSTILRPDFLAWFYEENGEYSVHNGYNMLLQEKLAGCG